MGRARVTAAEFDAADGVSDWRFMLGAIHAEFELRPFAEAAALVACIGEVADAKDHHPEMAIRYPGRVRVTLSSHDVGGLTEWDLDMARTISALAAAAGATARSWWILADVDGNEACVCTWQDRD